MTIQPEDPSYSVTEGPDTYLIVPIVVIGMKDPDVECTVQVFTVDGTAMGEQTFFSIPITAVTHMVGCIYSHKFPKICYAVTSLYNRSNKGSKHKDCSANV